MMKNKLILSTTALHQAATGVTTIQSKKAAELSCRLIKLACISLVCSSLYVCTSNAIVVPNPVEADKPIHVRSPIYMHKPKPVVVHKETSVKTNAWWRNEVYIKAGIGAMYWHKFKARYWSYFKKKPRTTPVYNIGIGRRINTSVRTDLNFQVAKAHYKADYLNQIIKTRALFINGYYDINPYKKITSYITAGIGVGNNKAGYLKEGVEHKCKGKATTNFIWNIGVGAIFKFNKNFGLDLGYRYMHLGNIKTSDGSDILIKGGKQTIRGHQILGALVYHF